ncbi:lipid A export permease/ATP-binding protein MsbA [Thioalkalivibrio thiocyanodenitrificans]|uniref:lipid A export permease/ATP-binding protein MsbA n=1 Tax=Thioalkalivibrio thiocyanodenitrificans TaxID=243063 RepID=UPI000380AA9B|nr:lipid A export permease/ATP-binding protein MsbA [Thioalkalivibrio thiocyanodenitrificans]
MTREPEQYTGVQVYRRLLGYSLRYWPVLALSVVTMIVVAATETGFAALMRPLMDDSFVARDPAAIKWVPLALIGIFALRGVAEFTAVYTMKYVGRMVVKELRGAMFHHLLGLPVRYYDGSSSGQLISRLSYNVEQVARAATDSVSILIRDTLTILGLLGWMFYLNWMLTLAVLIIAPMVALLVSQVTRRFRRISHRIQHNMGDVTQVVQEVIEGNRVVKIFGGEAYERDRFEDINENNRRLHMKMAFTHAMHLPLVQFFVALALALIVWLATLEPVLETVTVGTFVSFITALLLLLTPIRRLTNVNEMLQKGIAAGQSIFALLDSDLERDRGELRIRRARGDIQFRDVHFSYDADKGDVLCGIDLHIRPGETVALVGRSGSGKTTLVNMLPRFYDPQRGQVLLDGADVMQYRLADLRNQIAYVGQHVTLFNDTIGRNIAYGSLGDVSEEDIVRAAEAAHAMEFIRNLPKGLDTPVGDNGVMLSGGQRQRLAIARALLKDAPILILDEATSALDTEAERHIQAALENLIRNRTTLVIAHRLSTVERADRIVVMQDGTMVESGRHKELVERNGVYARLHRLQFEGESLG